MFAECTQIDVGKLSKQPQPTGEMIKKKSSDAVWWMLFSRVEESQQWMRSP